MTRHIVLSLSGGMDSATLLAHYLVRVNISADHIHAVSFSYGSKHNNYELEAAAKLCAYYEIEDYQRHDLSEIMGGFHSNLMQSGGDIPEGHYEAKSMSQTVVPGRNLIFASLLAGLAWSIGGDGGAIVALGIHAGDHAIYPDCRPEFFYSLGRTVGLATDHQVKMEAPFLEVSKSVILREGLEMGVPYHLTRTCYKDQPIACGKCGACQERLEAFIDNTTRDPIDCEFRNVLPKETK